MAHRVHNSEHGSFSWGVFFIGAIIVVLLAAGYFLFADRATSHVRRGFELPVQAPSLPRLPPRLPLPPGPNPSPLPRN